MNKYRSGVTFLLAVIIASLATSLGLSMSFVFIEELKLSGTSKDSFSAFFAADSGAECALFWDLEKNAFTKTGPGTTIICNAADDSDGDTVGGALVSNFNVELGPRCAKVKVDKSNPNLTIVTSLGQNVPCSASASPFNVQRGIEIRYY